LARCKFWEGWFFPSIELIAFKLGSITKLIGAQTFALTSNRFFVILDLFRRPAFRAGPPAEGMSIRPSYLGIKPDLPSPFPKPQQFASTIGIRTEGSE
jgi:hypothetical protein